MRVSTRGCICFHLDCLQTVAVKGLPSCGLMRVAQYFRVPLVQQLTIVYRSVLLFMNLKPSSMIRLEMWMDKDRKITINCNGKA